MRRLLRILLNAATVLSLVLCVATCVLWLRSYRLADTVLWLPAGGGERGYGYESGLGVFTFRMLVTSRPIGADQGENESVPITTGRRQRLSAWREEHSWHGFAAQRVSFSNPGKNLFGEWHLLSVPYGFMLSCGAVLPAFVLLRRLRSNRRNRAKPGRCPACGYDCRATPDRCPECGTAVVSKAGPPSEGLSETEGV